MLPLIADAVECFQSAGISNPEAKSITETLLTGAMRSYFRAGRRAIKWRDGGRAVQGGHDDLSRSSDRLSRDFQPTLAMKFRHDR